MPAALISSQAHNRMIRSIRRAFDLTSATTITAEETGMVTTIATSAAQSVRSIRVKYPAFAPRRNNRVRFNHRDGGARRAPNLRPPHPQRLNHPLRHGQRLGIAVVEQRPDALDFPDGRAGEREEHV